MKAKKIHVSVCLFLLLALGDTTFSGFVFKKNEYDEGYYFGSLVRSLNESFDCPSMVEIYNLETGSEKLIATTSFCRGFRNGRKNRPE